ncbi:PREDICTED: signal recognition particle 14 kDa protein [Pygoscelis adeliae]|uniref:signal recognition particle 14 kDa protein n=1 Tax=Pygoscelis adeliae TaxID=9238 RepID=UPI0004F4F7D8|nr:PREDICTED: signal recognition particle 14 kDa protein [Pygoscelis adeliae]
MEEKEINFPSEKHEVALDQMLLLRVPRSTNLGLTENSPFPESAPQEIRVLRFLTELTRLFQKCRTSGSVFITLKKYDGRTKPVPRKGHVESFEPADNKCLLRATDGKKKISTVVSSKEVNKFQMAYSNLLRANMDGLKKKDKKSKNKKSKATQ